MRFIALALAAAWLAACSTVESRISDHRAAFDASAPEVQRKIRAGQVDIGFTQEQTAMALGRPDRIVTRKTATAAREVWVYGGGGSSGASVGLGFGMGGPGFFGAETVAVGGPREEDPRLRVVFENGVVVSLENRR